MDKVYNNTRKKICIIIPYFGEWPRWLEYFLHSCVHNPSIDWIFPTDCSIPCINADNLKFISYKLKDFNQRARLVLNLDIELDYPYKICDFKPAFGEIFGDLIEDYDFWGYGDMDLVYGNIRDFYTDFLLEESDIISNHPDFITGHFCLLRNTPEINSLYRMGGAYKNAFMDTYYTGFDEQIKMIKINPDPRVMFLDKNVDRNIHLVKYRIIALIKILIPDCLKPRLRKTDLEKMADFSAIVRSMSQKGLLKVNYTKTFESDLMLSKKKKRNWKFEWKHGKLQNNEGSKILYFHFILSKNKSLFKIAKYKSDLDAFSISPEGIGQIII